jgi:amidase
MALALHSRETFEGDASARDLVERTFARIARVNPALNALVAECHIDARREAEALDRETQDGIVRGPLHGVPVTVKESFDIAGLRTTVNSRLLRTNTAAHDSVVVQRLKAAGAVIVGKTNVPPWLGDYQCFGPLYKCAANPFDLSRTPGGSGGGGAAAVAAGLCALDIGSDLAGSIRVPAHFCGVFGFKPGDNFAMLGSGHVPPWPGQRHALTPMIGIGPLARTMADIDLPWRAVLASPPPEAASSRQWRLRWYDEAGGIACDDDTKSVLQACLRKLQGLGVVVEKQPLNGDWLNEAYEIWALLAGAMAGQGASWPVRRAMQVMFGWARDGSSIPALRRWKDGLDLGAHDVEHLMQRREALIGSFERGFTDCDFLIGPVAAGPAFCHDRTRGAIRRGGIRYAYLDYAMPFAVPFNACGNPVLVVPAGRSAEGLPIGLQIAGPRGAEEKLIHFGRWLEKQGFAFTAPPGFGV